MKQSALLQITFAILALILPSSTVLAGNWQVDMTLKQKGEYQSNPLLLSSGAKEIYGSVTTPTIKIKSKTPTSFLLFQNSIVQNLFNESDFNSTDFYSNLRLQKKIERWKASLYGAFDHNTTRTSEITTFGTNTRNDDHTGFSISPELTFAPTIKNQYTLGGRYQSSRYDNNTANTDYNVYSGQFTWTHALSEFSSSLLSIKARRYQSQSSLNETVDSIGPTLGWKWNASEKLSTLIIVGAEASRQKRDGGTNNDKWIISNVFQGSLNYKDQQHDLSVELSRQQQPYSNGSSSLLTTLAFTEAYRFNPLLKGSVGARYQDAKASSLSSSNLKNKMMANAGISYTLTPELDLSTNYRYITQKLTNESGNQTDNRVMLQLTYKPNF